MSLTIYSIIVSIMVGLQEVAIAMSDPFGDDAVDLDTSGYLVTAEKNLKAYLDLLQSGHEIERVGGGQPVGVRAKPVAGASIGSSSSLAGIAAKAAGEEEGAAAMSAPPRGKNEGKKPPVMV